MYFKWTFFFGIMLLLTTLSCGLKIGEKNKTENIAEIKSAACLDQSLSHLKLFFVGEANEEQVSTAFVCLQSVLKDFKDNIRGKNKEAYTPEEISNFISSKFLEDDAPLSADLMSEIFKLKVVLVGGQQKLLTKSEIDGIVTIIAKLKADVVKLVPHMKIIVSKWVSDKEDLNTKERKFLNAKSAFEVFLNRVALLLAATERGYEIDDLVNFAVEAARYAKSDAKTIQKINDARLLVQKFKITMIGGQSVLIGKEWVPFGKTLGEALFQFLRFNYFHKNLNDTQIAEKWKVYEQVGLDISNLIQDLMIFKGSSLLKNQTIVELLNAAEPLLENITVNEGLIQQIGKFKIIFLGNHKDGKGADGWSQSDFSNLSIKIPPLFKSLVVVLQNIKELKVNKTGLKENEIKYEDFNKAEALVKNAIKDISDNVVDAYDLISLRALIVNLSETLLKGKIKLPDNFEDLVTLIKSAKYTLTGDEGIDLTKSNIQLLLNVGIRGYTNYVEFSNFVNVFSLSEKEFIYNFDKLLTKVKETLALELKLKSSHMIVTQEFAQLVLTAQKTKFIGTKLTEKGLNSLFVALWENILNKPEDRLAENKRVLPGLNGVAIQVIATELHHWVENQKIIADIYSSKNEYLKEDLLKELLKKEKTQALEELIHVITADGLMIFNDKKYLKILTNTYLDGFYRVSDLSNTNLARTFARIAVRSYANDLERVHNLLVDKSGITLTEAKFGFDQLSYFIFEMDLVEPENTEFISSRFREANLFLTVSNGDSLTKLESLADFKEINHLILHILSGASRAENLKKIAMEKCLKAEGETNSKKIFGLTCLLEMYYNEESSFAEMPGFAKLKFEKDEKGELKYSPKANKDFYLSLLFAAGYVPQNTTPEDERTIKLSDANLFPHVVQYVEMIFFRHDTNHDGYLQKDEALRAYPVFKETMNDLKNQMSILKDLEGNDLIGVFIWLLKKGTIFPIPAMKKFARDHECNLKNESTPCAQDWTINSTRLNIGSIFNLIAAATPKPPVVNPNQSPGTAPADTKQPSSP